MVIWASGIAAPALSLTDPVINPAIWADPMAVKQQTRLATSIMARHDLKDLLRIFMGTPYLGLNCPRSPTPFEKRHCFVVRTGHRPHLSDQALESSRKVVIDDCSSNAS